MSHQHLDAEQQAQQPQFDQSRARRIILLLTSSLGLMMAGYGLILPIFARRLEEIGAGEAVLGWMTMSFALGQMLFAPLMGSFADRWGRRPIILTALTGLVISNIMFLLTESVALFIGARFVQGAITAGLLPATMAIVGDIMPEQQRGRWVGIVMGGYVAGFTLGPALGGLLYDTLGYQAPFLLSAVVGVVALLFALVMVPETHQFSSHAEQHAPKTSLIGSLPRPLYLLGTLLLLDFVMVFTFAFVEPRMVYYFYNQLDLSTVQFGVFVTAYGVTGMLGQALLGHLSDRWGRTLPIMIGLSLSLIFYFGLLIFDAFSTLLIIALIGGLGPAMIVPALSAFYLDIAQEAHRSRVMGFKESAAALGAVGGPFLTAILTGWTTPQQIFMASAILTVVAALLPLLVLPAWQRQPSMVKKGRIEA
jgi:multidrug resistance protein